MKENICCVEKNTFMEAVIEVIELNLNVIVASNEKQNELPGMDC